MNKFEFNKFKIKVLCKRIWLRLQGKAEEEKELKEKQKRLERLGKK